MTAKPDDEIAHLRIAVERRTTIGMALGILMERFDLSQDQAFAYLQRMSSTGERKLYDVAHRLVRTRELPEAPSA